MPTPLEGQFQLVQIILVRIFPRPTAGEMIDRQSSGEQVSAVDSAANIEEECPWVYDEHQIAIRIDAVREMLQRGASSGNLR